MSREVRMIKDGWQHPTNGFYGTGEIRYIPLLKGSYDEDKRLWDEQLQKWREGFVFDYSAKQYVTKSDDAKGETFEDWHGSAPEIEDYMPAWDDGDATKLVMYETVSEGTPISPAFDTPEELARWLADDDARTANRFGATYEQWLNMIKKGRTAASFVIADGEIISGVAAMMPCE